MAIGPFSLVVSATDNDNLLGTDIAFSERSRAQGDIAKADRRWTRPAVVGGAVVTLAGSIIYDTLG